MDRTKWLSRNVRRPEYRPITPLGGMIRTAKRIAAHLEVSVNTLRTWIADYGLPVYRAGPRGQLIAYPKELQEWSNKFFSYSETMGPSSGFGPKSTLRPTSRCRRCGVIVRPPRRNWCGQVCVEAHKDETDWLRIRSRVRLRDHGVCALCGVNCLQAYAMLRILAYGEESLGVSADGEALTVWLHHWRIQKTWPRDLWEADHVVARCEGGTHDLENLRTLCLICHRKETAKLRASRSLGARQIPPVRTTLELLDTLV